MRTPVTSSSGVAQHDASALEGLFQARLDNLEASGLDPKTYSLGNIAALIAADAAPASYVFQVAFALEAGVSSEEILGLLVALNPTVGNIRIVSAAAEIAFALGIELDAEQDLKEALMPFIAAPALRRRRRSRFLRRSRRVPTRPMQPGPAAPSQSQPQRRPAPFNTSDEQIAQLTPACLPFMTPRALHQQVAEEAEVLELIAPNLVVRGYGSSVPAPQLGAGPARPGIPALSRARRHAAPHRRLS